MRVVFMGTPDFSVETLKRLIESGQDVVGVVTQPDKPKGRSRELIMTPVKAVAVAHTIPVLQPKHVREPEAIAQISTWRPDVIVVAAFGQIIPEEILIMPRYGCVNVHASLLPKYRGAAPIQWAVINGEKTSGVTIMQMDEGIDTGDMIEQEQVELADDETGGSLFDKLAETGASLLVRTLDKIENGTAVYKPQPKESPTPYAAMITKQMGQIDWERPAVEIERLIRGLNPWPSAYTKLGGRMLKIWAATAVETEKDNAPGTVVQVDQDDFFVQTTDGALRIEELQLEGKKRMKVGDFLRGYSLEKGEVLC